MKKVSYRKTHKGRGRALGRFVACLSAVLVCFLTSCSACTAVRIEWEFDLSLVEGVKTDSVTRLYYFNGAGEATELEDGVLCGSRISSYVPLSDMPRELLDAFVAIEDKNFFRHHGVDVLRTVRAGINYFTRLSPAYGASTITQQLVKNLTGKDEVTPARKLQEIVYAVDLERKLDKTEILELYLNIINLSESCYGVGAAAERYFSKSVGELNLAECACLAAITKNPSYYDPVTNPANNAERRRVILAEMLEQGYIGREEYDTWYLYEPELNLTEFKRGVSSWYTDMVVEDVICDLVAEFGYSRAAASRAVYGGGLRIYTLQDPEIQRCVEDYYSDASNFPEDNEQGRSAVIVIDPESGAVLGVAGAIGEKCADRVQSYATDTRRPSGSTIKPLAVYAPGLEEGTLTWATVYDDVPTEFLENADGSYRTWPNNADLTFRGLTNIRYAVQNSLNTVAVRALEDLGADRAYEYLTEGFGLKSWVSEDRGAAALALGQQSYGVTLRELTAAYSAFANGGIYTEPRSYSLVMTCDGEILLEREQTSRRVISEANAAVMTKLLQTVVSGASGAKVTLRDSIEVAGKTGTTQNCCDRWFVGYTPYCLCGVWYGNEYPSALPTSTRTVCSETFNAVMTAIHADYLADGGDRSFYVPEGVVQAEFCCDSGGTVTEACELDPRGSRHEVGWFAQGTQPSAPCDRHMTVDYDVKTGGVACPFCPRENVTRVSLVRVDRSFPTEVTVTDAQYAACGFPYGMTMCCDGRHSYFAGTLSDGRFCGVSDCERQFNGGCGLHTSPSYVAFGRRSYGKRDDGDE